MRYILGVDVGGTYVRMGMIDENFCLSEYEMISTASLQEDDFINSFADVLNDYINRHSNEFSVKLISIGFPSTIDKSRKSILSTPNIIGLNNVSVVDVLEKKTNKSVIIDRDVNMLFYYDLYHFGIAKSEIVLGFYVGTGFGNVIYIDKNIIRGRHGVAGELGHTPVMGKYDECNCGNKGCVEIYASGLALEHMWREHYSDIPINAIFKERGTDQRVLELVEKISIPIIGEINLFDPDYIVLGGGILKMDGFPKELLEQAICGSARKPYPANDLRILYSLSEQQNGVIGAGIYGFAELDREHSI